MSGLQGKAYLRNKLNGFKSRNKTRYDYYEQENLRRNPSPVMPERLSTLYETRLGWCTKSVDSLANRLVFDGFENDNFAIWEIFEANNKDILFDSAIRSALIVGCSFVYISASEEGYPRLQVIDGKNATGIIDPITNLLKEGYAVLETDNRGNITKEAYFTEEYTEFTEEGRSRTLYNTAGYPLLVPIIHHPDANKPFGQSRISHGAMNLEDKARWATSAMAVNVEFNSFPQKYILGTAEGSDLDTVKATYTSFLEITKDEDGDRPTVGQFQQANMASMTDAINAYARLFAGLTGLTTDDLGFVSENPSSAESIKAGHGDLERLASKAQDIFGSGFLNVGLVAACLRDEFHYRREALYETVPVWKPAFIMDNSSMGAFGDAVIKINEAVPNAISARTIGRLTGLPIEG